MSKYGYTDEHASAGLAAELPELETWPNQFPGYEIEITIREGRNRQVRRMCDHIGHPVLELERISFGPLRLEGLAAGGYRRLSEAELGSLRAL